MTGLVTGLLEQVLSLPGWLAVAVVFALPALESSVFLGFVFPGELALLLGGVVAGLGHAPLAVVLSAGVGGAILGDGVGYLVGRRWGRRILGSTLGRFVKADHFDRAERVLRRRGMLAVFLGRFTVALRVLIPGLAGMAQMPYRRFLLANVLGAVTWGGALVVAGDLAGSNWHTVEHWVTTVGVGVTAAVAALLMGRWAARRWHRRPLGRAGRTANAAA